MKDANSNKNDQRHENYLERPLPSSEPAERCILGGILIDNKLMAEAAETLQPEDFYSPLNKKIYQAMLNLHMQGKAIDPILIIEEMKKEGPVEALGGMGSIQQLMSGLPYFSSLTEYIKVVTDTKQKRDIVRTCNQIVSETLSEEDDIDVLADRVEQAIFSVCERPVASKPERLDVLAHASLERTRSMMRDGVKVVGVRSGLKDLDEKTGGARKGELIIVAGRPSMGKSAFAGQWALEGTVDDGVVLVCTLEMTKDMMTARYICSEARIDLHWYMKGDPLPIHFEKAVRAYTPLTGRKLYIDDTPGISPMQVLAKGRRIYAEFKRLDLIVVDYLGLMNPGTKGNKSREQEVSQISRDLKAVARILNVPVIALSQLSRAPEVRNPPRPLMSDLRDSGAIEQDADLVIFVYREDYYKETEENRGMAELIVAKNRNGPTGPVKCTFLKSFTRFENYYAEN